jgi:hypothetical protein
LPIHFIHSTSYLEGIMPNEQYTDRLRSYLSNAGKGENGHTPFTVHEIQHLGVGLTVVHDSLDEYDIFFDKDCWEPTTDVWEDSHYPPVLGPFNLGVLMGYWQVTNPVHSFEMAEVFAKRWLKPKNGGSWHDPLPAVQKEV